MIAVVPFLVAIVGLLLFVLPGISGKVQQIGLALFVAAMVALMIAWSHVSVHLG